MSSVILGNIEGLYAEIVFDNDDVSYKFPAAYETAIGSFLFKKIGARFNKYEGLWYIRASLWCKKALKDDVLIGDGFKIRIIERERPAYEV